MAIEIAIVGCLSERASKSNDTARMTPLMRRRPLRDVDKPNVLTAALAAMVPTLKKAAR